MTKHVYEEYEGTLKLSENVLVGDQIHIAGMLCEVTKIEDIFHYVPKNRLRFALKIVGATSKRQSSILFLPHGVPVTVVS